MPGVAVLEVDVPLSEEVHENYLEVREAGTGSVATVLELLSPANKIHTKGRLEYETKRNHVLSTLTNLVEIDLLRASEPMPIVGPVPLTDYRILISRGARRPRANLYTFSVRQPIPAFPLPLFPADPEPEVKLGTILHDLYDRGRYDLRLDYTRPAVPPLSEDDAAWAARLVEDAARRA